MCGNLPYCNDKEKKHVRSTCLKKHAKIHEKIENTDCYDLHVFSLLEFLHCWLSECSCTCVASINQTFETCSNVSTLFYLGYVQCTSEIGKKDLF